MFKFFKKIFPSKHEKDVKELWPYVDEINQFDEEYQKLSDDELRAKTQEFKDIINAAKKEIDFQQIPSMGCSIKWK